MTVKRAKNLTGPNKPKSFQKKNHSMSEFYYQDQLEKVYPFATEYAPTIKVFANGNGEDTKHISLNKESAKVLVEWLTRNYIAYNVPVKVTNWDEVEKQFGELSIKEYKTPLEIHRDLTTGAFDNLGIAKVVAVPYQRVNVDSGICTFEFKEWENGVLIFEYTGTAK